MENTEKLERCLLIGANHRVYYTGENLYKTYEHTGLNTGNLLIGHAVNSHFPNNDRTGIVFSRLLTANEISEFREKYDKVLIAAANFIHEHFDFTVMGINLKKLNLPVVVFGIGAQASDSKNLDIPLIEGTRNFLYTISDLSTSIGVRGEFTAKVLEKMGIKNTTIIGCPSYYLTKDKNFKMQDDGWDFTGKYAIGFTDINNTLEQKLIATAYKNKYDMIGQMEIIEDYWSKINTGLTMPVSYIDTYTAESNSRMKIYSKLFNADKTEVMKYFNEHFKQYYSMDEWFTNIENYEFVFTTRIHGNMCALLNKVPSIMITHDSRTTELAEFFAIPSVSLKEYSKYKNVEKLINDKLDYSKFNKEYEAKFINFEKFVKENGLSL